jgi:hypothetical protein
MNPSIREQLEFHGFTPTIKLPKRKDPAIMCFLTKETMKETEIKENKFIVCAPFQAIPRIYQWH